MENSLINKIKKIISLKEDAILTLKDFDNLYSDYSYESVKRTINQLVQNNLLSQVYSGIYYKPRYISTLNIYTKPNYEAVAYAIAKRNGWEITPTGVRSLNLLGLSTQNSFNYVFASTGPYKEYDFNGLKIIFKRTKLNEILNHSYETKLLIQALKTLGKDNISDNDILFLKNKLPFKLKNQILFESKYITNWIYKYIRKICQ